jgi:hypothetical protein
MDKILQAAFKDNQEKIFIPSNYLWNDSPMEFIHLYPLLICDRINVGQIRILRLVDGTEFPIPHNKETGKAYIASLGSQGNGIVLKNENPPQGQPTMAEKLQQEYLSDNTCICIPLKFLANTGKYCTVKEIIQSHISSINNGTESLILSDKSYFKLPHNCSFKPMASINGIMLYITPVDKNISVSIKGSKSNTIAYTIQCTGDSCIDSLKKTIARIDASTDFKLMFNGVYLDDDSKTLKDVGIKHGSVISVVWLDQIKAKARSILTAWLSMVRAFPHGGPEKQTEEQRLIKLRDQAAAAMMEMSQSVSFFNRIVGKTAAVNLEKEKKAASLFKKQLGDFSIKILDTIESASGCGENNVYIYQPDFMEEWGGVKFRDWIASIPELKEGFKITFDCDCVYIQWPVLVVK